MPFVGCPDPAVATVVADETVGLVVGPEVDVPELHAESVAPTMSTPPTRTRLPNSRLRCGISTAALPPTCCRWWQSRPHHWCCGTPWREARVSTGAIRATLAVLVLQLEASPSGWVLRRGESTRGSLPLEGTGNALKLAAQTKQAVRCRRQFFPAAHALATLALILGGNVVHDPLEKLADYDLFVLTVDADLRRILRHTVNVGAAAVDLERLPLFQPSASVDLQPPEAELGAPQTSTMAPGRRQMSGTCWLDHRVSEDRTHSGLEGV
jgi:hypothetical protein